MLKVEHLSFERDDRAVISDLSFSVDEGEILQIEGANGAGKTTLLRLLTTALQATAGRIFYMGMPIDDYRFEYLDDSLFIGHQTAVKAVLSPEENLASCVMPGPAARQRIQNALLDVGLAGYEDVPCHRLSAGQQRRVALARLQLENCKLWFLDEPFAAIDKQGVEFLHQRMAAHVGRGGAILLSTHQELTLNGVRRLRLDGKQH